MQKKIKIVIDTCVWIEYMFSKRTNDALTKIFTDSRFEIISNTELKNEVLSTAKRPKFLKLIPANVIEMLEIFFEDRTKDVQTKSKVKVCRDPKDDYLLSLCKDSKADYLISIDKDLLVIKNFEGSTICSLTEFYKLYLQNND